VSSLTSARRRRPVPFVGARHRLQAMVLSFVVGEVGCHVTWCCDVRRHHCCVQWWLGSNGGPWGTHRAS